MLWKGRSTIFDSRAISKRQRIPSSISSRAPSVDTSTFGVPVANFPATGCKIDTFFQPQNLVFDITLCGGSSSIPIQRQHGRVNVDYLATSFIVDFGE